MIELSRDEARRMALGAQGFTTPRPTGRIDRRHLRKVFDRIGVIQIDSVNVLVRSQELPLFARLGPHPRTLLWDAIASGEIFEYWAHVAALIPATDHRLWRFQMARHQSAGTWYARLEKSHPGFVAEVLERVRREGPLLAADLSRRTTKKGSWWDWDEGKEALELLFAQGQLLAKRRPSDFAKVYDLPERILPAAALAMPEPSEAEARSELLVQAARSLGVATAGDLADYYRQSVTVCRPLFKELVADGRLVAATVEGWKGPAYVHPAATVPRRVGGVAFLSPFDSLVWNRDRNLRLFDFHYRIEIYTPAAKRQYGYYVLPVLVDGHIVARVDLKADRLGGQLLVQHAHEEPGHDAHAAADRIATELLAMAGWLKLDQVSVTGRGDLAPALHAAVARLAPT